MKIFRDTARTIETTPHAMRTYLKFPGALGLAEPDDLDELATISSELSSDEDSQEDVLVGELGEVYLTWKVQKV